MTLAAGGDIPGGRLPPREAQYQSVCIARENNRMRQPMIATAAPTQKNTQCGAGTMRAPPMMNPTTTTEVPTQEMGLPELCSRCGVPCATAPAVPVPSTVPAACSATTPPSDLTLPMLRLSRKYPSMPRDPVAGPPISPTMAGEACPVQAADPAHVRHIPSPAARSTTRSAFDPRQHPSRRRRQDPASTQADQRADQLR